MSETTENTAQSEEVVTKQNSEELLNIQAAYRQNGKNYLRWSQVVRTSLKGKGKLSHLLGIRPKPGDPRFHAWDEEDSMIMSWLWNSMTPEISDTCMLLPRKRTYGKQFDRHIQRFMMLLSMRLKSRLLPLNKEVA